MKIGGFAKEFNLTVDTVRYYIELGLLIPEKKNTRYHMTRACMSDMEFISELKQNDFSLKEIHKILSLKRLANIDDNEDTSYFESMLLEKRTSLKKEKKRISKAIRSIDKKINTNMKAMPVDTAKGVPLYFMSLFSCPHCQQLLNLKDAEMYGQDLNNGTLYCTCGYQAVIEKGILRTDAIRSSSSKYSIYEIDIKKWNPGFISLLEKGKLWMTSELRKHQLERKVLVETNLEVSMMLPKYLSFLPEDTYYVFTCHSLGMIEKLKKRIEKYHPNVNVLYIVNSDLLLPLKHQSIDFYIDSTSFTQYSLVYKESPIMTIKPYLKEAAHIIGNFVFYESDAKSLNNLRMVYEDVNPDAFYLQFLTEGLQKYGLHLSKGEKVGFATDPGHYFSYHDVGEKMKLLAYTANCNE